MANAADTDLPADAAAANALSADAAPLSEEAAVVVLVFPSVEPLVAPFAEAVPAAAEFGSD